MKFILLLLVFTFLLARKLQRDGTRKILRKTLHLKTPSEVS